MTRSQDWPQASTSPGRVTRVFQDVAAAVIWLTLGTGGVLGVTPDHEIWTFEDGWVCARSLELGDTVDSLDGTPIPIVGIQRNERASEVFNLEVDGTFTYFANGIWVYNNSCPARRDIWRGRHGAWEHVEGGRETMLQLIDRGIPEKNIRWNQSLVSPDGKHWNEIRPDVQYIDDEGFVHAI